MNESSDQEPLLLGKKNESSYDSITNNNKKKDDDYYSVLQTKEGLASIVSERQLGVLKSLGGNGALWKDIIIQSSSSECSTLKEGLNHNHHEMISRLSKLYGRNELPPPLKPKLLELMIAAGMDPTMIMLLGGAIISLLFGDEWIEGISIAVTITLVISITALTDYSKGNEFYKQQIELENKKSVHVIRNGGTNMIIHPRDLVVGDVVRLSVGDIAPADGILFQASNDLKMDESALTGETELITKRVWDNDNNNNKVVVVDPFIISGTNVMQGSGLYFILAVGIQSIQGKILSRIREQEDNDDNDNEKESGGCGSAIKSFFTFGGNDDENGAVGLMDKLDILAMDIGKAGTIVSILVFLIMLFEFIYTEFILGGECSSSSNENDEASCLSISEQCSFSNNICYRTFHWESDIAVINEFFITAITILVVAVPEGLPLAVTLALAISGKRMMNDSNQVKHMDSTETMGSATTICSDKTGTLTENKMTVMKIMYGNNMDKVYEYIVGDNNNDDCTDLGSIMKQKLGDDDEGTTTTTTILQNQSLLLLAEAILLNVSPTSKVTWKETTGDAQYEGNPTDCALIKLTMQLGFHDANMIRQPHQRNDNSSMLDWGVHNIPFSSERKRMSWIVEQPTADNTLLPYNGKYRLYCKGAPQQVMDSCTYIVTSIMNNNTNKTGRRRHRPEIVTTFTQDKKQHVMNLISKWQNNGLRTLAISYRDFQDEPNNNSGGWNEVVDLEANMTLLAIVGIEDPLRASVPGAIQECVKAGIDVRMCTGDALSTAIAIAKGCKILRNKDIDPLTNQPKEGFAMTGAEFNDLVHVKDPMKPKVIRRVFDPKINDSVDCLAEQFLLDESGNKVLDQQAFDEIWPTLRVLARCQPEDKLTLVRGMRKSRVFLDEARCAELYAEHGIRIFPDYQVVAVTGDGTNDAPALKSANVGFAMGIAGTETAKQACDIILLDDNFSSIVKAVMWGRNVFDSISKFIQFQLTVNVVAITLAVVGAFTYNESPLTPVQMLWVNMIMDSLASLALATEQPTKELLDRMPYGKRRPVISPVMTANIIGHSIYQIAILFWVLFKPTTLPIDPPIEFEPHKGSLNWSIFFNVFVMLQLFNEFNARRLPTPERLRTTFSEWNVFQGVWTNPLFVFIMVGSFTFQILLVEFVGTPVSVVTGGLSSSQWIFCFGAGAGSLIWQLFINIMIVIFAPIQFERKESDTIIESARKFTSEELEAATSLLSEPSISNWDRVRLGVRRDILYARVFNISVRSGAKISRMVRCSEGSRRSEEYYRMLGKQMSMAREDSF